MAGRTETRTCEQCKRLFEFEIWRGKQYPGRFCSVTCNNLSQRVNLVDRILANLSQPTTAGCIEWTGKTNDERGYGRIHAGNGSRKMIYIHRWAWEMANGQSVPKGMFVCHRCDNPLCANPNHLFLGEPKENSADMTKKKRQAYGARQGAAKLTDGKVRSIIRLNSAGTLTQSEIAAKYGVTKGTIHRIVIGKNWKHITAPPSKHRLPSSASE